MGSMSLAHWLIVLVIVLLLFGASRLSDVGKGLGEGIKNFKKGLKEEGEDDEDAPPKPVKRKVIDAEEVEDVKATPKQLTTGARVAATAAADDDDEEQEIIVVKKKKKKTITVEVDDDADEEEVQRKVAAAKRQAAAEKDA